MNRVHGPTPPLVPESQEHAVRRVGVYLQFLNPRRRWAEMEAEAEALVDEYRGLVPTRGPREGSARFL